MTDLQCAATVVVLAVPGEEDVARLRQERAALVYSGDIPMRRVAAGLADHLGVPLRTLADDDAAPLRGEVTGTRGWLAAVAREVADEHRGELVVVVAEGVPATVLRVDDDGWTSEEWPVSGAIGR